MKRSTMAIAAMAAMLSSAAGPTRRETPSLRYYSALDTIGRTKQRDQQAKLARRQRMHALDHQLWARQARQWA